MKTQKTLLSLLAVLFIVGTLWCEGISQTDTPQEGYYPNHPIQTLNDEEGFDIRFEE